MGSSQGNDSQSQRTGRVWADRGRLRMMAGAGLLGSVLIGAVIVLVKYGPGLGDADRYRVTLDEIHVTEPPDWVRADVATLKSQAAELAELDLPLDLQQPKVTVEVAEAFRRHPWVKTVKQVEKKYPARIEVQLEYRKPVAMVEMDEGRRALPVDAEGICLPTDDFTEDQVQAYPHIRDPGTRPSTKYAGFPWGDARVAGAAQIAAVLLPHWDKLPLAAIQVPPLQASAGVAGRGYLLESDDGQTIVWGNSPGEESPGEAAAPAKLAYLVQLFGTPDNQPRTLPETIDLRLVDHGVRSARRP